MTSYLLFRDGDCRNARYISNVALQQQYQVYIRQVGLFSPSHHRAKQQAIPHTNRHLKKNLPPALTVLRPLHTSQNDLSHPRHYIPRAPATLARHRRLSRLRPSIIRDSLDNTVSPRPRALGRHGLRHGLLAQRRHLSGRIHRLTLERPGLPLRSDQPACIRRQPQRRSGGTGRCMRGLLRAVR